MQGYKYNLDFFFFFYIKTTVFFEEKKLNYECNLAFLKSAPK